MKNLLIAIWNSIKNPDFQKIVAYVATIEFIYYAIGIIAFTTVAMALSLFVMALAVMPWYYVVLGVLVWIGMAVAFSYAFDKIMRHIIKD